MNLGTLVFCTADNHRHIVRFDCESMPLLREKLADLIGEALIDEETGMFLWRSACLLASEMEAMS